MIRRGDGEGGGEVEREYGDSIGEVGDEDDVSARGEGYRGLPKATSLSIVFTTENSDISESQSLYRGIWRAT